MKTGRLDKRAMEAKLQRTSYNSTETLGLLVIEGQEFCTLEPPREYNGLENVVGECCIPEGLYELVPLEKSASGKYTNVFWVKGVEGRSGILIHNGNTVDHTRGCILIGMERGMLMGKVAVLASREARDALWQFNSQNITLRVTSAQPSHNAVAAKRSWTSIFSDFTNWITSFFRSTNR